MLLASLLLGAGCTGSEDPWQGGTGMDPGAQPDSGALQPEVQDGAPPPVVEPDAGADPVAPDAGPDELPQGCAQQPDADGDGEPALTCGGADCDDSDPEVGPGRPELCNGRDDDCNGSVDDGANCAPGVPSTALDVAVFMARHVKSCFVGAPCDPAIDDCTTGLYDDSGSLVHPVRAGTLIGLPSSTAGSDLNGPALCLDLVMSDEQRSDAVAQLEQFRSNVLAWTSGAVQLTIHTYDLDDIDVRQDAYGDGTWIAPWAVRSSVLDKLDLVPDFNIILTATRDPAQQLHHNIGACGLTLGADAGLAGAGWSWIPVTKGAFWFECANADVMVHEWLHQVHTAYHQLSGFVDAYDGDYPACGEAGDPHLWFPDTHQCNEDPDWHDCGLESCGDGVSEHVLRVHWDPSVDFVANHCEDGIEDMGETGIDSGGECQDLPLRTGP